MFKKLLTHPIFWIFLLALVLRLYNLSEVPYGFHADEARVGWNAYSILKTGADDWGNKFTLHYNTFGDFRPTGYFYLTIPSLLIFGVNEFAVRFPGALAGSLTVVSLYFLLSKLSPKNPNSNVQGPISPAILGALLLSLSPWHISLSRATSEGVVAIFLALTGLIFLLRLLNSSKNPLLPFVLALLFLLSSYFFYHSARLLVPLLVAATTLYILWPQLKNHKPALFVCVILFAATFLFSLNPAARGRFNQVGIFTDLDVKYELDKMPFDEGPNKVFIARLFHNKPSVYARRFINEYTQYISSKFFLVPKEAKPGRYQTVGMGILTYVEFGLLILGLVAIAQKKPFTTPLVLLLLLLSPLPGALTTEDAPNLHRSAFMIPFLASVEAFGLYGVFKIKKKKKLITSFVIIALTLNFIFFWHQYFTHNKVGNTLSRNIGAKELGIRLSQLAPEYSSVLVTNIPDSPYPWVAFFGKLDPKTFNEMASIRDKGVWSYNNLTFTSTRCPSRDAFNTQTPLPGKILVVDAEACETEAGKYNYGEAVKIKEQIKRPDDTVVYTIWARE